MTRVLTINQTKAPPADLLGQLSSSERAVYLQVPQEIEWVHNEMFDMPGAQDELFGPAATVIEIAPWVDYPELGDDLDAPVRRARRASLKTPQERLLFLRYNFACFRASRLVALQRRRPSLLHLRQIVQWYQRVLKLRGDLVNANMALVLAMAKRTQIPGVEFAELVSEGSMALLRSVEKFDVARGFKFSTYACRAILKSFNRLATRTGRYRQRFPVEFDPDLEQIDQGKQRHHNEELSAVEALQEVLDGNLANLNDLERTIVRERYALDAGGKKRTLSEVGKTVGLTNERVRQIQNRAFSKIRQALEEEVAAD